MSTRLAVSATLAVLALLAVDLGAQVTFGAAGGWYTLSGEDFDDTDAGFGVDGSIRFPVAPRFELGGGAQYNTHSVDGFDGDLGMLGVFAEGRLRFPLSTGSVEPFVAPRVFYIHQSLSDGGLDFTANGYAIGGLGGLLFRMSPSVSLEASVALYHASFGDVDRDGQAIPQSDSSGNSLGLRVGLAVGS